MFQYKVTGPDGKTQRYRGFAPVTEKRMKSIADDSQLVSVAIVFVDGDTDTWIVERTDEARDELRRFYANDLGFREAEKLVIYQMLPYTRFSFDSA